MENNKRLKWATLKGLHCDVIGTYSWFFTILQIPEPQHALTQLVLNLEGCTGNILFRCYIQCLSLILYHMGCFRGHEFQFFFI